MNRDRLTNERIRAFACPADRQQAFLWDTVSPRLAVRATVTAKAFVFEAKLDRRTIRSTIGDVSAWTVEAARAEARRLQTLIDRGIDPRQERADRLTQAEARRAQEQRSQATVAEAWAAYVEARRSRWSARHARDHEKLTEAGGRARKRGKGDIAPGPLASLMPSRLADLDADAVESWLAREAAARPTQAALAYRMLRAFMNWAAESKEFRGQVRANAISTRAIRDVLPRPRAKDDCLQREQLAAWFAAVLRVRNPVIRAYLQVVLLTGARREEILGLGWDDVDFQWRALTIRDKVEGARSIPMTPYVESLLIEMKARRLHPSPWVFPSPTAASGRLNEPGIQHRKACAAAGLEGLTLHGLRRSFGTLAEWVEAPVGIVAQLMGHKPSAIAEKHYRRRPLDLLRVWHVKIEAWILDQAGIEQPKQAAYPALKVVD